MAALPARLARGDGDPARVQRHGRGGRPRRGLRRPLAARPSRSPGRARSRRESASATRLVCSIGLAPNKLMAKIASDLDKPDGLCVLTERELARARSASSPRRCFPASARRPPSGLRRRDRDRRRARRRRPGRRSSGRFGPHHGPALRDSRQRHRRQRARRPSASRKSESRETTFPYDVSDRDELRRDARPPRRLGLREPRRARPRGPHGDAEDPAPPLEDLHPLEDAPSPTRDPTRSSRGRARAARALRPAGARCACSGSASRGWLRREPQRSGAGAPGGGRAPGRSTLDLELRCANWWLGPARWSRTRASPSGRRSGPTRGCPR